MNGALISYGLMGALAIALVVAAATDLHRRQIDNWLTGAVAFAAPLFWWSAGLNWAEIGWHAGVALAAFAVLTLCWALKAIGGGDVKLLTALALWLQPELFFSLLMRMAVLGGVLCVVIWMWKVARRIQHRPMVPYGLAIALAGLWVLGGDYLPIIRAGGHLG